MDAILRTSPSLDQLRIAAGVALPPRTLDRSTWPAEALARSDALRAPPPPGRPGQRRIRVTRESCARLTDAEREEYGYREHVRAVVRDLGGGHKEGTAHTHVTLSDIPPHWMDSKPPQAGASLDPLASRESSAKRAKRQMRRRCKALGLDVLGTLTYRENVQDRARVLRDWKEFVRRLRRVLPGFAYVAVVEKQKRGALHLHFACKRLPMAFQRDGVRVKSYSVIYAIWKSVTGDAGGSFRDSSRRTRGSVLKVAKYIAKYVGKCFEDHELNKRQYFAGGEWSAPLVTERLFRPDEWIEAICYLDESTGGDEREWFQRSDIGLYWVASYSPPS